MYVLGTVTTCSMWCVNDGAQTSIFIKMGVKVGGIQAPNHPTMDQQAQAPRWVDLSSGDDDFAVSDELLETCRADSVTLSKPPTVYPKRLKRNLGLTFSQF